MAWIYRHDRRRRRYWPRIVGGILCVVVVALAGSTALLLDHTPPHHALQKAVVPNPRSTPVGPQAGDVLSVDSVVTFTANEATTIARRNYGGSTLPVASSVTKITFQYRSQEPDGTFITEYARAYIPVTSSKYPIFAFAPGTTGIADRCAASLENPAVANWADYDAHMLEYAGQGFAGVITDYEGMRDATRLHHYMSGEREGRAVLDSVRALRRLPAAKNRLQTDMVFVAGYSQGGHAAYWADALAPTYAKDVTIKGVIGFGPVLNVQETLADVAQKANINWFGPYVLRSYADLYQRNYPLNRILHPPWIPHLADDVNKNCIDTDIAYWGHDPAKVYTPEFLTSINSANFATDYPELAEDLQRNAVPDAKTSSAKLVNQGQFDNVVLPQQAVSAMPGLCASSLGPVTLQPYPATHYTTMVQSLRNTLAWMNKLQAGDTPLSTCQTK